MLRWGGGPKATPSMAAPLACGVREPSLSQKQLPELPVGHGTAVSPGGHPGTLHGLMLASLVYLALPIR